MEQNSNPINIMDIASKTGFGKSTVARALANQPGVKPETRQIILETARKMGYVPNIAARHLASSEKNGITVGIVIPHLTNPFYTQVVEALYLQCKERSLRMVLYAIFSDEEKEQEIGRLLDEGRESHYIFVSSSLSASHHALIKNRLVNVVLYDAVDRLIPWVCCNNEAGGRMAAHTLLDRNHSDIAILTDAYHSSQVAARMTGFLAELSRAGLTIADSRIKSVNVVDSEIDDALDLIFSNRPPTALFCINDLIAYRTIQYCGARGLAPGKDISIMGFDDLPSSRFLGLTTIRQPLSALAEHAVNMLLDNSGESRSIDPKVIIRESVI